MKSFFCSECKLHYDAESWAQACGVFCKQFSATNLEITQHSIEFLREIGD